MNISAYFLINKYVKFHVFIIRDQLTRKKQTTNFWIIPFCCCTNYDERLTCGTAQSRVLLPHPEFSPVPAVSTSTENVTRHKSSAVTRSRALQRLYAVMRSYG